MLTNTNSIQYIYEIIKIWQNQAIKQIQLSRNKNISTTLFADDQVIISDSEDNLQTVLTTQNNNQIWFNNLN
jgi:hypothetical protein